MFEYFLVLALIMLFGMLFIMFLPGGKKWKRKILTKDSIAWYNEKIKRLEKIKEEGWKLES